MLAVVVAALTALVLTVEGGAAVLALAGGGPSSSPGSAVAAPAATATPAPDAGSPTASPVAVPPTAAPSAAPPSPVPTRPTRAATAAPAPRSPAAALLPVVGVTDGDTIKVRVDGVTERIRLIGLDAPELKGNECWSQKASSRMQGLVQGRSVQLVPDPTQADRDRYGRLLRHVVTEDGRLVAQVLIEGGFATEYTYAAAYEHRTAYLAAQKRARAGRLGVWSAACSAPVAAAPPPAAGPAAPAKPSSCVVKGNISSSGEKIYHVPGGGSYDDTVITPAKGERWFCSEQAAEAAGWRRARN